MPPFRQRLTASARFGWEAGVEVAVAEASSRHAEGI